MNKLKALWAKLTPTAKAGIIFFCLGYLAAWIVRVL